MAHVKARSRGRRYSERRAGGRGAGPRAAGAGNWRLGAGCAMRIQPTDAAQIVATGALHPSRIPIRAPAVAATDDGRWAPGRVKRVIAPQPGQPEGIALRTCTTGRAGCASAPRRSGRSPTFAWITAAPTARIPHPCAAVAATDRGRRAAERGP
jgi:hypothetical protein